jgi:hypothetical protein
MPDDSVRGAAEEYVFDPGVAVRGHDDQIHILLLGFAQDLVMRIPRPYR